MSENLEVMFEIPLAIKADEKRSGRPALSSKLVVTNQDMESEGFINFIKMTLAEKGADALKFLWLNGTTAMPETLGFSQVLEVTESASAASMMDSWRSYVEKTFTSLAEKWLAETKGFSADKITAYSKNYISVFSKFPHGRTEVSEVQLGQVKKLLALAREWDSTDTGADNSGLIQWASNKAGAKIAVTVDMI
jgi:hypothetical protein